jgi:hypothetical protein
MTRRSGGRATQAVFVVGSISRTNSRFDSHKDVVMPPARGPWTPPTDALPSAADPGECERERERELYQPH